MNPKIYKDLKEVHITKTGIQEAIKEINKQKGTVAVSKNGAQKVIADGNDWSNTFQSLALNNLDVSNITNFSHL